MVDTYIIFSRNKSLDEILFWDDEGWTELLDNAQEFSTFEEASKVLSSLRPSIISGRWTRGIDLHPRYRYE